MSNPRLTSKERGLLKGAIRRVFSRSELRRKAVEQSRIDYTDAKRPRVTKWSLCEVCKQPTPTYLMQVDHKEPVVPIDVRFEEMTFDTLIDRMWCEYRNLTPMCKPCHSLKTKAENKLRREKRKEKK